MRFLNSTSSGRLFDGTIVFGLAPPNSWGGRDVERGGRGGKVEGLEEELCTKGGF